MGTELPTKVMLGQTLVLMQMTFLNNVRKVGSLVLSRTSCCNNVLPHMMISEDTSLMLSVFDSTCHRATLQLNEALYIVSSKIIGRQNDFSPPTPFETCGRNVTVCSANICCYRSNTFSITEMLSVSINIQTIVLNTHEQTLDKCDFRKITTASHTTKECFPHG
jgi:hypothetical protein